MKRLRNKLRARKGLTMVEMLAAVVVLTLLCLALNSGMNVAMHAYRTMVAEAETQTLLSTASTAIVEELRYAKPTDFSGNTLTQYTSAHYGQYASIDINNKGELVVRNATDSVDGHPVLSSGVYGKSGVYKLSFGDDGITYDPATKLFTFTLRAEQKDLASAEETFTVRCLNGGLT